MKCESRNHLFNEASAYRKMQYLVRVTFVSSGPKLQFKGQKTEQLLLLKLENNSERGHSVFFFFFICNLGVVVD